MKRCIAALLLSVLLLGFLAPAVRAEETTAATEETEEKTLGGWLDDSFRWELVDGTLTITGSGSLPGTAPWRDYADQIEKLFFDGTIYSIPGGAFRDCENLKEIQFSSALSEIGDYAFQGCSSIEEIRLPDTFRRFGVSCFEGCDSLRRVYCEGYMPNFRENCLWNGGKIVIFYQPAKPWSVDDIATLEKNFGGRLEVLCSDGTDPITDGDEEEPQQETVPATTEAPTVATEPPTVATEPPTVPTVPETTLPETTVPPTTVPEVTLSETVPEPTVQMSQPTEPVEVEQETVKSGFVGLALIVGVLSFFIVGALAFKFRSREDY